MYFDQSEASKSKMAARGSQNGRGFFEGRCFFLPRCDFFQKIEFPGVKCEYEQLEPRKFRKSLINLLPVIYMFNAYFRGEHRVSVGGISLLICYVAVSMI